MTLYCKSLEVPVDAVDIEIDASRLSEQRRCPVARVVVIQPVPEGAEIRFDYGDFFFEKAGRGAAVD